MSVYLAPGVFVEEISFRPSAITPASTSVAAIVGPTRTGIVGGRPQLLTSFADYTTYYGDDSPLSFAGTQVLNHTAYAARAFFDNGGRQLYLARIVNDTLAQGPKSAQAATASLAIAGGAATFLNLTARFPGAAGNLSIVLQPVRSPKLLSANPAPANDTTDTLLLKLSNVAEASLVGVNATLPNAAFPLVSLSAMATLTSVASTALTGGNVLVPPRPDIGPSRRGAGLAALDTQRAGLHAQSSSMKQHHTGVDYRPPGGRTMAKAAASTRAYMTPRNRHRASYMRQKVQAENIDCEDKVIPTRVETMVNPPSYSK